MGTESERRRDFEVVYRKYRHAIYQTAFMYVRNREDAEDIAQEAFTRYYVHSAHNVVDNPKSWIAVTAKNLAYNHLKHAKYERLLSEGEDIDTLLESEPDFTDSFFENMWKRDRLEYTDRVLRAMKLKNERWYDAMIYAYGMEMLRQDIADCMGVTLDALSGMLRRAKNWIRENYEDEFDHITKL